MYLKDDVYKQLKDMGVPQDKPVIVHTSLKAIGEVCGRGEGFLLTLIEYVTEKGGLLVIPTHTWQRAEDNLNPTLVMDSNEVCIGTLPKIAATFKGVHRSCHPTHSVAVFGDTKAAENLIKGDRFVKTQSDPKGTLGELKRQGGYILLIGVGQESNTYIHTAEEELGVKGRFTDFSYPAVVRFADGSEITTPVRLLHAPGIGDVSEHYPKLQAAFDYDGIVKYGKIGNAKAQLLKASDIDKTLEKILNRAKRKELLADDLPLDKSLYE